MRPRLPLQIWSARPSPARGSVRFDLPGQGRIQILEVGVYVALAFCSLSCTSRGLPSDSDHNDISSTDSSADSGEESTEDADADAGATSDSPPDLPPSCVRAELHISTRAELDAASDVCEVTGLLRLGGGALEGSLGGLFALERAGSVEIRNTALTDLSGLEALTSISSHLFMFENEVLEDLASLASLQSIGSLALFKMPGYLVGDTALQVTGFQGVGHVEVENTYFVVILSHLGSLTDLSAHRELVYEEPNPRLRYAQIALPSLTSSAYLERIAGDVGVLWLREWPNDDFLGSLFGTDLWMLVVEDSPSLLGLAGLEGVSSLEVLSLSRNDMLANLSAIPTESLRELAIGDCGVSQSLVDGGDFYRRDNPSLLDLSSLPPLPPLERLMIVGQSGPTDLTPAITPVSQSLELYGNAVLAQEDAVAFHAAVGSPDDGTVSANGVGETPIPELCEWRFHLIAD